MRVAWAVYYREFAIARAKGDPLLAVVVADKEVARRRALRRLRHVTAVHVVRYRGPMDGAPIL